jgi:hypothetical protein
MQFYRQVPTFQIYVMILSSGKKTETAHSPKMLTQPTRLQSVHLFIDYITSKEHNEFGRIWKTTVLVWSDHLPGGTERNHRNHEEYYCLLWCNIMQPIDISDNIQVVIPSSSWRVSLATSQQKQMANSLAYSRTSPKLYWSKLHQLWEPQF